MQISCVHSSTRPLANCFWWLTFNGWISLLCCPGTFRSFWSFAKLQVATIELHYYRHPMPASILDAHPFLATFNYRAGWSIKERERESILIDLYVALEVWPAPPVSVWLCIDWFGIDSFRMLVALGVIFRGTAKSNANLSSLVMLSFSGTCCANGEV